LKAFVAEVSAFGESTAKDSLPRVFIDWANDRMTHKHVIFDEETCTDVVVGDTLALAVMEVALLGRTWARASDKYRDESLCELFLAATDDAAKPKAAPEVAQGGAEFKKERLSRLVRRFLSPSVQVKAPSEAEKEDARLSPEEVTQVFIDHVPGVLDFLYRGQPGNLSLDFMVGAYQDGFQAFSGTEIHEHLLSSFRLVVHHGFDNKPAAAKHLCQIAEAFMDCQAVQARTVEKVSLQIRGVAMDFRGHLVQLIDEYKAMAVKILAVEECTKRGGPDAHHDPAHFESRLVADLGERLGLNEGIVKQGKLDEHAQARFRILQGAKLGKAEKRIHELFDMGALLKAFAAEAVTFGASTANDSLPRLFIDWASEHMSQKHLIFDEDTCSHVVVDDSLALAVLEVVFLGRPRAAVDERYRGELLSEVFVADAAVEVEAEAALSSAEAEALVANERSDEAVLILEVDCGSFWSPLTPDVLQKVAEAKKEGRKEVHFSSRGFKYLLDLVAMMQVNLATGKARSVRYGGSNDNHGDEDEDESDKSDD